MATVQPSPLATIAPYGGAGVLTQVVDATNDSAGAILTAYKDGSITHLGRWVSAKTGTGTTGYMQMETLTGSPGLPSGTLWDSPTDTRGADDITATGWAWIELNDPGDVVAGDSFAAVYSATAADGSNNATLSYGLAIGINSALYPFSCNRVAGTWGIQTAAPIIAAKYSDGDIIYGSMPIIGFSASAAIADDTTPDEVGVAWTAPISGTCFGAEIVASVSNLNFTGTARIYQDTTELAAHTLTGTRFRAASSVGRVVVRWSSPVTITAGQKYRVVIRGTSASATGNIRLVDLTYESATSLQEAGSALLYKTSRSNDTGSFTDDTDNIVSIAPLMDTETAGGGLLVHPGMTGGIRG